MKKVQTTLLVIYTLLLFVPPGCKKPAVSGLPQAQLKDLQGGTVDLAQYNGKPMIINFWATWCGPCRLQIPMLNELHKKYASSGLVIIGISTDEEGASVVKPFLKEVPMAYPSYLKGSDTEEKFGGIWALPTNYFFDKNGKQIDKLLGLQPREVFEEKIHSMIR